jgi:hypothetical protein
MILNVFRASLRSSSGGQLYLVSSHSVWQCDDTTYCKYTIVLLKMSAAMLETR